MGTSCLLFVKAFQHTPVLHEAMNAVQGSWRPGFGSYPQSMLLADGQARVPQVKPLTRGSPGQTSSDGKMSNLVQSLKVLDEMASEGLIPSGV